MEDLSICLSTADFPPFAHGGLARYSTELFAALRNIGLDVTLVAPVPLKESVYQDGEIDSFHMPFHSNRVLRYPLFNLMSLGPKFAKDYDVIHSLSTQHEVGLSRIVTRNLILTVHNTFFQQIGMGYSNPGLDRLLRKGFYTYMSQWEKIACSSASRLIAVSEGTKESLVDAYGQPPGKIEVIYSGVDLGKFQKDQELNPALGLKSDYFLYVGRIVPRKGLAFGLRALRLVKKELPAARFVIVGRGERTYREGLVRLAQQLGIADDVHFLGEVPDEDLPALYRHASMVLFPSLVEGFGLVCLEAMACGTPVIASDIPGTREVIVHGENGLLVPPMKPEALARAILKLVSNPGLRTKMGENGRRHAGQFTWTKTAKEVHSCYRDIALT